MISQSLSLSAIPFGKKTRRRLSPDRVVDKEKSNFCDYFKAGNPGSVTGTSKIDAARAAAEALFKKK